MPICCRISSHFGYTSERYHIVSFVVIDDESPAIAQKVSCWSQSYSARAKLMLISDQEGDLDRRKIALKTASLSFFQTRWSTSLILNKSTGKVAFADLCGDSESY